jgi:hypothetical protein
MIRNVLLLALLCFGSSCVPDVYLLDRQTVLEVEAAGDWPELDEEIFQTTRRMGPVSFRGDPENPEKQKLIRLADGDYGAK